MSTNSEFPMLALQDWKRSIVVKPDLKTQQQIFAAV
jgi:hypothetical protein